MTQFSNLWRSHYLKNDVRIGTRLFGIPVGDFSRWDRIHSENYLKSEKKKEGRFLTDPTKPACCVDWTRESQKLYHQHDFKKSTQKKDVFLLMETKRKIWVGFVKNYCTRVRLLTRFKIKKIAQTLLKSALCVALLQTIHLMRWFCTDSRRSLYVKYLVIILAPKMQQNLCYGALASFFPFLPVSADCPKLPSIPLTYPVYSWCTTESQEVNRTCIFVCVRGYSLENDPHRVSFRFVCQGDGTWSGKIHKCVGKFWRNGSN